MSGMKVLFLLAVSLFIAHAQDDSQLLDSPLFKSEDETTQQRALLSYGKNFPGYKCPGAGPDIVSMFVFTQGVHGRNSYGKWRSGLLKSIIKTFSKYGVPKSIKVVVDKKKKVFQRVRFNKNYYVSPAQKREGIKFVVRVRINYTNICDPLKKMIADEILHAAQASTKIKHGVYVR